MKLCSFEGCGRKHAAKGYCETHYAQMLHGRPMAPIKPMGTRTHCVHGHAWKEAGFYIDKHGTKVCKACAKASRQRWIASAGRTPGGRETRCGIDVQK